MIAFSLPGVRQDMLICNFHVFHDQPSPCLASMDLDQQADLPRNIFLNHPRPLLQLARYGTHITIKKFKRTLSLVRFNAPPNREVAKYPSELRLCPCGEGIIEMMEHINLY